jgi:hypothetical protein
MTGKISPLFKEVLHKVKVAEIKKRYPKNKGYAFAEDYEIEQGVKADLYVKTPTGKVTIFEVIVPPVGKNHQNNLEQMLAISKQLGYEFRTVSVIPPFIPKIEIDWLGKAILEYFRTNTQDTTTLLAHVHYEELEELEILSVKITDQVISLYVSGSVSVRLPNIKNDEAEPTRYVLFEGTLWLTPSERKIEQADLKIDDSFLVFS